MTSLEPHSSGEVGVGRRSRVGEFAFTQGRRLANCMVAPQGFFFSPISPKRVESPLTRCLLESLPQLQPQDLDFQSWAGPSASSRLALVCDSKTNSNEGSDSHGFLGPWYIQSLSFSTWSLNLATNLP